MKMKKYIAIVLGTVTISLLAALSPAAALSDVNAAQENGQTQDKAEEKAEESAGEKTGEKSEEKTEEKAEEKSEEKTEETTEEKTEEKSEEKTEESAEDKTEEKAEEKTEESTGEKSETADEAATEEVVLSEEEQAEKDREDARKALQNDPNHIHNFKWIAKMGDSESAEGTMNYICEECGKIWFFRPISAYVAFQGDVAHRIEKAAEGETVRVKTSHFINFTQSVMKALSERPDVSLYVSFLDQEYKGNRVSFTIPAGEDTTSLLDENGYVGFLFLGNKYGLTMEEPMIVQEAEENTKEEVKEETKEDAEVSEAE